MTYPTVPVSTVNMDAGTDRPADARSNFLDLATKFNALMPLPADLAAPTGAGMVGGAGQVVASIAALRLLRKTSASKQAFVTGYYAQGDGGGGAYYYDSADTTTADNGGTVIVATDGGRWKMANQSSLDVRQFGAKCDGVTIDTAAVFSAYSALQTGAELRFPDGQTTLMDATWVLTKPVIISLGARETGIIKFKSSGTYLAAPFKAAIIVKHTTTVITGYSGDARRSRINGGAIVCEAGTTGLRGVLSCAPAYYENLQVTGFSSDGFATIATNGTIAGNANGCSFINTESISNGGAGYYFSGSDANACALISARASGNAGWGFYEDSLLGNTYLMTETDGNASGGYYGPASPTTNRSSYFGCYAESNQTPAWELGEKSICFAPIGAQADVSAAGLCLAMLPGSIAHLNRTTRWAVNQDIANTLGTGAFPGLASEVAPGMLTLQTRSTKDPLKIADYSASYAAFSLGTINVMQIPYANISGNLVKGRPYFGGGLSLGGSGRSAIIGGSNVAPTTGTYDAGAIMFNDLPAAGGKIGWVCVSAGTPGTWKAFGPIDA